MSEGSPKDSLRLEVLPGEFAVCRADAPPDASLSTLLADEMTSAGDGSAELWSLTVTGNEVSLVCDANAVPPGLRAEREWRAMRVVGVLDFSLIGILASLTVALAEAGVSVFAISTFDTDYLLVRGQQLDTAARALREAGCTVDENGVVDSE